MPVSKKKRFRVFNRDAFTCQYCGRTPPAVVLQVDHMVSRKDGGSDDEDNLVTACVDCNSGKSSLSTVPPSAPDMEAAVKEQREALAQAKAYNRFLEEVRDAEEEALNEIDARMWIEAGQTLTRTGRRSVAKFVRTLPVSEIIEGLNIAVDKCGAGFFRYWMGVLRRMEMARNDPEALELEKTADKIMWALKRRTAYFPPGTKAMVVKILKDFSPTYVLQVAESGDYYNGSGGHASSFLAFFGGARCSEKK